MSILFSLISETAGLILIGHLLAEYIQLWGVSQATSLLKNDRKQEIIEHLLINSTRANSQ